MSNKTNESKHISLNALKKTGISEIKQDVEGARRLLVKAEEDIDFMRASHSLGKNDWTVIAGYHAFYHAATAALLSIGLKPIREEGVVEAFRLFFTSYGGVFDGCKKYEKQALKLPLKYGDGFVKVKKQRDVILHSGSNVADYDVHWITKDAPKLVEKIIDWINER